MTVCDAIVNHLLKWSVDVVFGLPSDGINGLMEALRKTRSNLRYVHMRHEEAVAMAATDYAKFTEKLGVCFTTSGPCAIHTHLVRWGRFGKKLGLVGSDNDASRPDKGDEKHK